MILDKRLKFFKKCHSTSFIIFYLQEQLYMLNDSIGTLTCAQFFISYLLGTELSNSIECTFSLLVTLLPQFFVEVFYICVVTHDINIESTSWIHTKVNTISFLFFFLKDFVRKRKREHIQAGRTTGRRRSRLPTE